MSSDLLAEFDSFYRSPQDAKSNSTPALNDLAQLGGDNGKGQSAQQSGFPQWQSAQKANDDIWGNMNTFQQPTNTQPNTTQQSDIWGSLGSLQSQQQPSAPLPSASGPGNYAFPTNNSRGHIQQMNPGTLQKPTFDMFSSNTIPSSQPAPANNVGMGPLSPQKQPATTSSSHGDVLFDATEEQSFPEDDDDEFGEFETVTSESTFQSSPPTQSQEISGNTALQSGPNQKPTDISFVPANYNHNIMSFAPVHKPATFQQSSPFPNSSFSTGQAPQIKKDEKPKPSTSAAMRPEPGSKHKVSKSITSKALAIPAEQADDEWGDFSPETPAMASAKASSSMDADSWAWDTASEPTKAAPAEVNAAPPTNIPPPSVFLTIFPSFFDLPQSKLFTPVAGQTFSLKNQILSHPDVIEFLRGYLLIATVAGRILAGRKLRWKRDTILAQSMRMGPSAAGGKGGMKLAGVDKAEITREDREAAEVARIWKDQLGRLRSAVAVSNSSTRESSQQLTIPDVSENIHVKTQTGAVTAPKPCIICGLKRDERANKVDVDVEDSFGEWWVDHWGHRTCRNFWLEHESKLRSR